MKPDYTKYQLVPDDQDFEDDETMDAEEFTQKIVSGIKAITESERGERKLRTSENVNGQWIERKETGREFRARRAHEAEEGQAVRYDPTVDALYIDLSKADVGDTREVESGILLDYDQAGNVIGVEILDFMARIRRRKATKEVAPAGILDSSEARAVQEHLAETFKSSKPQGSVEVYTVEETPTRENKP